MNDLFKLFSTSGMASYSKPEDKALTRERERLLKEQEERDAAKRAAAQVAEVAPDLGEPLECEVKTGADRQKGSHGSVRSDRG